MKILCLHRQQSAVGYYRTWLPARALARAGHDVTWWEDAPYSTIFHRYYLKNKEKLLPDQEKEQLWLWENLAERYDILLTDRPIKFKESANLAGFRHWSPNCRMITDFDDDFLDIPNWNPAKPKFDIGQEYREAGLAHLRVSEMTTVSTETLVERFGKYAHQIRYAPNLIEPADWDIYPVNPERQYDDAIRILYGGAVGHYGDLDAVRPGLEAFLRNPPVPIRFFTIGAAPAWLYELRKEFPDRIWNIDWQSIHDYPAIVAWGGFDITIAPLAEHPFNLAKSNIKYLESAVQKIPFFGSNIGPYADIPAGCAIRADNDPEIWEEGLATLCTDKDLRVSLAEEAYKDVMENWTLDAKGHLWHNIVEEAATLPRITRKEDTRLPSDPAPLISED